MMNLMPRNFYLDDIFDDMEKEMKRNNHMKCDVIENDNNYQVEVDIPGYNKEDIKIEYLDGLLTITAEKTKEHHEESKKKKYIRRERYFGKVSRSFSFSDIEEDNIDAEFKNGTLLLTIPKKDKNNDKKIINIK